MLKERPAMSPQKASLLSGCGNGQSHCVCGIIADSLYFLSQSELSSSGIVLHLWNNDSGEESALSTPSWF
jgi:hypothetical protein